MAGISFTTIFHIHGTWPWLVIITAGTWIFCKYVLFNGTCVEVVVGFVYLACVALISIRERGVAGCCTSSEARGKIE